MPRAQAPTHPLQRVDDARKHRHGHRPDHELPPRRTPPRGAMKKPRKAKPLRILVLMDKALVPPEETADLSPGKIAPFKTELDVYTHLKSLGHEVMKLGVLDDLGPIRDAVDLFKPHVAFNLLEGFHDFHVF